MKFLIIFAVTFAFASVLHARNVKSRNLVVPAGRPEGRVTNGNDAFKGQLPYQVHLLNKKRDGFQYECGGSLIHNRFVLTAAHCIQHVVEVTVTLGSTDSRYAEVVHTVTDEKIFMHPDFDLEVVANDIALIEIPFTDYTDFIQPIKLPPISSSDYKYENDDVIISGWGLTSDKTMDIPSNLQWAYRTTIPNRVCERTYWNLLPSNICISTYGRVSTCSGDSGGPMVLQSSGVQIGIASFGHYLGCELGHPRVFTRVTSYLDWIKEHSGVFY